MPASRGFSSAQVEHWSLPSRDAFLESVTPQEMQFIRSTAQALFFSCLVGIAEPGLAHREPAWRCWVRPGMIQGSGLLSRPDWRIYRGNDLMIKNEGSWGRRWWSNDQEWKKPGGSKKQRKIPLRLQRRFERERYLRLIKTDVEERRRLIWCGERRPFYVLCSFIN